MPRLAARGSLGAGHGVHAVSVEAAKIKLCSNGNFFFGFVSVLFKGGSVVVGFGLVLIWA